MAVEYSFDEKCLDLARHFFPDAVEPFLKDVAQLLQDTIEAIPTEPDSALETGAGCDG